MLLIEGDTSFHVNTIPSVLVFLFSFSFFFKRKSLNFCYFDISCPKEFLPFFIPGFTHLFLEAQILVFLLLFIFIFG